MNDTQHETTPRTLEITAPARLHLGLYSFGGQGRQFGGVGVMVNDPAVTMRATAAQEFSAIGHACELVQDYGHRFAAFHDLPRPPAVQLATLAAPERHVGLGSGTQMGLCTAKLLAAWEALPSSSPVELAASVGRGLRSAVGAYGFDAGGLVVESGKIDLESLSPLEHQCPIDASWRFVLVRPANATGLWGREERSAFAQLPPVPKETTKRLIAITRQQMIPAVEQADFQQFSDAVFEYGQSAGSCFAPLQGGPYRGPVLTRLVEVIRNMGVQGVAQSSWGPTLFAICLNQEAADSFAATLQQTWEGEPLEITITQANNHGSQLVNSTGA